MSTDDELRDFLESLLPEKDENLRKLEDRAHADHVPVIRPVSLRLLQYIVAEKQPRSILEIGTATGYSAIAMHLCQPEGGRVVTLERNEKRYRQACENTDCFHMSGDIRIIQGDAAQSLKRLFRDGERFDLIFIDAAKAQYREFWDLSLPMLDYPGTVICDNVLQDGTLKDSIFAGPRRDHTVHRRMRDFLYYITHLEQVDTVVLPLGDGMTVSRLCKE